MSGRSSQLEDKGRDGVEADTLLVWYDRHRRKLPWRAPPGERADPYAVWLSEIMLQQTTVRAVAPYYARFLARWPTVESLAAAPLEDVLKEWAGLGYYARARNLHACARAVVTHWSAVFPQTEAELRALPGVGAYTAAAIAAIAFDEPVTPVDGNVERVLSRLYAVEEALPAAKPRLRDLAHSLTPQRRAGDFAQALMDLGATICTPKRPACALCPWNDGCLARARQQQETFPRKAEKRVGALRTGAVFWAVREDGCVLLRTRAAHGLLGGMTEFPGSDWRADADDDLLRAAPRFGRSRIDWRTLPGVVTHTFTHFPLRLTVYAARVARGARAPAGMRWTPVSALNGEALPTVMRKVAAHALARTSPEHGHRVSFSPRRA